MSIPLYAADLRLISAVTDALNELGKSGALDANEHYYLHVELREVNTHDKLGAWSDEIASDAWYFDPADPKEAKNG